MIIAGPIVALFGSKLFRPAIAVVGFFLGAYGMLWILDRVNNMNSAAAVIICIVVGIAAAFLAWALAKWAVYIAGGVGGFIIGNMLYQLIVQAFNPSSMSRAISQTVIDIFFILLFALIAHWIFRPALKIFTAVIGGYMFAAAVDFFGNRAGSWHETSFDPSYGFFSKSFGCHGGICGLLFVLWFVVSMIGLIVQFVCWRDNDKQQPANIEPQYDDKNRNKDTHHVSMDMNMKHTKHTENGMGPTDSNQPDV
jgi:beta-lactamase regulating signal transducer with metallopeptidase domain